MQHEQWASVQIEQPSFVAKKGVWALGCCYLTAFAAILTVGLLGPKPLLHKTYRDVDYDIDKVRGSSIDYNEDTGDALWTLNLHKLVPDKQFIHINARLQRPGWNDGPKSARNIDFTFKQEYTLFSEMGTTKHFLTQHSDAMANHSHHHKVKCLAKKRFCEPFMVYHKDYLATSAIHLEVKFWRPEFVYTGGQKPKSIHQISQEEILEREHEKHLQDQAQGEKQVSDQADADALADMESWGQEEEAEADRESSTTTAASEEVAQGNKEEEEKEAAAAAAAAATAACFDHDDEVAAMAKKGQPTSCAGIIDLLGQQQTCDVYACPTCPFAGKCDQSCGFCARRLGSPPLLPLGKAAVAADATQQGQYPTRFLRQLQHGQEQTQKQKQEERWEEQQKQHRGARRWVTSVAAAVVEYPNSRLLENPNDVGEGGGDRGFDDTDEAMPEGSAGGGGGGLSSWLGSWKSGGDGGVLSSSSSSSSSSASTQSPTPSPNLSPQPTPMPTFDFFNFHEDAPWTLLMETVTVNKNYTKYELGLRYTFLALTCLVLFWFATRLRQLSTQMWGYQQKWVLALLSMLILFDGPLTAFRIYTVNDVNLQDYDSPSEHDRNEASKQVLNTVSSNQQTSRVLTDLCMFCTTSFVAVIMVYFLAILEEMGSGGVWQYFGCEFCLKRSVSNSLKVLVVGSFWAATFSAYLTQAHAQERDPGFTLFDQDEEELTPWVVTIAVLLALYLLWLLVLLLDAFRALKGLTSPFRFIALITLVTIVVVLVGPFFGAYYSIPKSAAAFAVIFGLVNLYVYVLAFSYLPKLDDLAVSSTDEGFGEIMGELGGGGIGMDDEDDDDMGTLELTGGGGHDGMGYGRVEHDGLTSEYDDYEEDA